MRRGTDSSPEHEPIRRSLPLSGFGMELDTSLSPLPLVKDPSRFQPIGVESEDFASVSPNFGGGCLDSDAQEILERLVADDRDGETDAEISGITAAAPVSSAPSSTQSLPVPLQLPRVVAQLHLSVEDVVRLAAPAKLRHGGEPSERALEHRRLLVRCVEGASVERRLDGAGATELQHERRELPQATPTRILDDVGNAFLLAKSNDSDGEKGHADGVVEVRGSGSVRFRLGPVLANWLERHEANTTVAYPAEDLALHPRIEHIEASASEDLDGGDRAQTDGSKSSEETAAPGKDAKT